MGWWKPNRANDQSPNHAAAPADTAFADILAFQPMLTLDMSGTVLGVNDAFLALTGHSRSEVLNHSETQFIPPEERGSHENTILWQRLRRGECVTGEQKRLCKSGQPIWVQATHKPICDINGQPSSVIVLATDITEAKLQAIDMTEQVKAIHRSNAVIEFKLDGTILAANANFCAVMGYRPDEIIGKYHRMFVDDRYAASAEYRAFWNALGQGRYFSAEFERLNKSGETVWIQASYNPIYDAEGRPIKVIKIATDITAEVTQRAINERLSLVADNTDNSVIITDQHRRIQYVNAGFERITGYKADDVIGKKPGEFLQGKLTDPATIERMRHKLRHAEAFYEEILNYNSKGEPYWISLAINPVRGADGEVRRFISIQADITETKRKALEYSVKLDAISQSNAIAEWTVDGVFLDCNSALADLGALDSGVAVHLDSLLSKKEREKLLAGTKNRTELSWPRSSGASVRLDAVFVALFDISGVPYRLMMCGADISDRREAVEMTTAAVKDVVVSGEQIAKAVSTIDGIAFQTSVLAINAAIEAAHAGKFGQSFAVVAEQVRNLANKSSEAANSISGLVTHNRDRMATLENSLQQLKGKSPGRERSIDLHAISRPEGLAGHPTA